MSYSLVLLSAGSGKRMEHKIPKQFLMLAGKPVIMHTLERIDEIDEIDEIVIVANADYHEHIRILIHNRMIQKKCVLVEGGATRQESTLNGINAATNDDIIIHEAARPFVKKEEFSALIACDAKNALYGAPINFTVLKGKDHVEELLERETLVNVQLPQKFNRNSLLAAHNKAKEEGKEFTEDASVLFEYSDEDISILKGSEYNIKLTTPVDMIIGEQIYRDYILNGEA